MGANVEFRDFYARCWDVLHMMTEEMRVQLPQWLSRRLGPNWKMTPLGKEFNSHKKLRSLDFSMCVKFVKDLNLGEVDEEVDKRLRWFRNDLAHHKLTSIEQLKQRSKLFVSLARKLDLSCVADIERLLSSSDSQNITRESIATDSPASVYHDPLKQSLFEKEGDDFMNRGCFQEAIGSFSNALCIAPPTCTLYLKRASAEVKLQKWDLVQEDAEDALELDEKNGEAYSLLVDALIEQGNEEEAIGVLKRGCKKSPRDTKLAVRLRDLSARRKSLNWARGSGLDLLPNQLRPFLQPQEVADIMEQGKQITLKQFRQRANNLMKSSEFVLAGQKARDAGKLATAVVNYEKAIEMDNAEAMYNLAVFMLPTSEYGLKNPTRALQLLNRAAEQPHAHRIEGMPSNIPNLGVSESENALGCCYRDGSCVDKDLVRAKSWFSKAARHGNVWAMNSLGCILRDEGRGSWLEARKWFEEAVKLNLSEAKFNLAQMLLKGEGGPKDIDRAKKFATEASDSGVSAATRLLNKIGASGSTGIPDSRAVVQRLRAAAAKEDVMAWTEYANFLLYDLIDKVESDYAEVEALLKKAAAKDYVPAMLLLANYYRGMKKFKDLHDILLKAAQKGNSEAQKQLGSMLLSGNGVQANRKEAEKWFQRARRQGEELPESGVEGFSKFFESMNDYPELKSLDMQHDSNKVIKPISDPSAVPYPIALQVVQERARNGDIAAQEYIKGHNLFTQAVTFAKNCRHEDAVNALADASELMDILPPSAFELSLLSSSVKQVLSVRPGSPSALYCLGYLRDLGRSMQVLILALREGVSKNPRDARLLVFLARVLCMCNKSDEALPYFNRAEECAQVPKTQLYYLRGVCRLNLGEDEKAKTDLLKFLKLAPPGYHKVQEAWYKLAASVLACCNGNPLRYRRLVQGYVMKAEEMERARLPVFPPCDVTPEVELVNLFLRVKPKMIL